MYPDLSYLLHDLFGTPVDNWTSIFKTFGLFFVLAILGAAFVLYLELKRKASEGLFTPQTHVVMEGKSISPWDLIGNIIFGFIFGFKLVHLWQHLREFLNDPSVIIVSLEGSWVGGIVGALFFAGIKYWEAYHKQLPEPVLKKLSFLPHHYIGEITTIAAVAGIFGAKLFDVVEHMEDFFADPLGTLVSGSGFAIYGGLIFGFLAVFAYLRIKKISPIHVMDAAAPALFIAYGIGRLGCHFSGDGDWGIVNALTQPNWWILPDWLWAYDYPHNVLMAGVEIEGCTWKYCTVLKEAVFPTAFYEAMAGFGLGGILWALRTKVSIPGMLFCIYLILNGIERFFIEFIRVNDQYTLLGIEVTQAQVIAVGLVLAGMIGGALLWTKNQRKVEIAQ